MMFLQFFVWGTWFSTLAQCLGTNGLDDFGAGAYGTVPIAAMIAPLFLGLIADRFFPSQIVMGILFLIGVLPAAAREWRERRRSACTASATRGHSSAP